MVDSEEDEEDSPASGSWKKSYVEEIPRSSALTPPPQEAAKEKEEEEEVAEARGEEEEEMDGMPGPLIPADGKARKPRRKAGAARSKGAITRPPALPQPQPMRGFSRDDDEDDDNDNDGLGKEECEGPAAGGSKPKVPPIPIHRLSNKTSSSPLSSPRYSISGQSGAGSLSPRPRVIESGSPRGSNSRMSISGLSLPNGSSPRMSRTTLGLRGPSSMGIKEPLQSLHGDANAAASSGAGSGEEEGEEEKEEGEEGEGGEPAMEGHASPKVSRASHRDASHFDHDHHAAAQPAALLIIFITPSYPNHCRMTNWPGCAAPAARQMPRQSCRGSSNARRQSGSAMRP